MKKAILVILVFIAFISCKKNNIEREKKIIVNHYKNVGLTLTPMFVYQTQSGVDIGSTKWDFFYGNITGFEFEPGYIYDLTVKSTPINKSLVDGGSTYELKKVNSKVIVDQNITFNIYFKLHGTNFISGNPTIGFKILNEQIFDCGNFCDSLTQALSSSNKTVIGKFKRKINGEYILIGLEYM